jgi:S-adenosylmethionine:tRNA ribosyltransferase-isomerase
VASTQSIAFVTGNAGKLASATEHLAPLGIDLEQVRLELDEIQSTNVREVAMHKAQQAFRAIKRPLIIEDSGFGIDELDGYPGPMVKHLLAAAGAKGIARLADLTERRTCRFVSVLVYIDAHGVPRVFTDEGGDCTIAPEPAEPVGNIGWSELWDVVIPAGGTAPLSAQPKEEAEAEAERWKKNSNFRRFGNWYAAKATPPQPAAGERMRSRELNFEFPADRIADRPRRDGGDLLLIVDRKTGDLQHRVFEDLPELLPQRSLVVVNNSAVVRAALRKLPDDGTYLHITTPFHDDLLDVEVLCPWKPAVGSAIQIRGGRFLVTSAPEPGRDLRTGTIVPDDTSVTKLGEFMERHGEVPIPIYVNAQRDPDEADAADYQNVYASVPGSVACPTAGLHLSQARIAELRAAGHDVVEVTLHIGYGTWKSLSAEYVDEHRMDAETCSVSAVALATIRAAKAEGRPIVAVGTSSVRTLETFADQILAADDPAGPLSADTELYISPGFGFRVVDHMVTNFAYPQTPIMAMTAAFTGSFELLREAYTEAVADPRYRFLTYGDAMLLH